MTFTDCMMHICEHLGGKYHGQNVFIRFFIIHTKREPIIPTQWYTCANLFILGQIYVMIFISKSG
jgi:hypothetical protein